VTPSPFAWRFFLRIIADWERVINDLNSNEILGRHVGRMPYVADLYSRQTRRGGPHQWCQRIDKGSNPTGIYQITLMKVPSILTASASSGFSV